MIGIFCIISYENIFMFKSPYIYCSPVLPHARIFHKTNGKIWIKKSWNDAWNTAWLGGWIWWLSCERRKSKVVKFIQYCISIVIISLPSSSRVQLFKRPPTWHASVWGMRFSHNFAYEKQSALNKCVRRNLRQKKNHIKYLYNNSNSNSIISYCNRWVKERCCCSSLLDMKISELLL